MRKALQEGTGVPVAVGVGVLVGVGVRVAVGVFDGPGVGVNAGVLVGAGTVISDESEQYGLPGTEFPLDAYLRKTWEEAVVNPGLVQKISAEILPLLSYGSGEKAQIPGLPEEKRMKSTS